MLLRLLKLMFGSRNDRILNELYSIVNHINSLEKYVVKLSDQELQNKTVLFKNDLQNGKILDDLLPEAFAVVRESSKRILNMRHFDVQILGGIVLHNKCIAEMYTGEGKTLTSILSIYLNALNGNGVHVVTMNEYLCKRDAEKHRMLFEFLGLTVGLNMSGLSIADKKKVYSSDIIYGTHNEFCFDYLRDNMVFSNQDCVQNQLNYVLIDEVDSILIDEARTPVVLSGASVNRSEIYRKINDIVLYLTMQKKYNIQCSNKIGHFHIDEETRQINLTEYGFRIVEKFLYDSCLIHNNDSLYSSYNIILIQNVIDALRAHNIFQKNVDYIIQDNKVVIVDEYTGRLMGHYRWSDGLHQAIEAKEKLKIFSENQILASITFQNYFKLYKKISGMTGTASTEMLEFSYIYDLDTIIIPTNRSIIRKDYSDVLYITVQEKYDAIVKDIQKCVFINQPVLVGTISIEKSEMISRRLFQLGIENNVLNAKNVIEEAKIISQAGKLSSVTISTNMAGRGTDIVLGGNKKLRMECHSDQEYKMHQLSWKREHDLVILSGGLHIIGTERYESRRIDNQLRGRSGRQGDPGSSRFYLSMDDTLIRIFIPNKIKIMIRRLGIKVGCSLENSWITKAIYHAQKKIENQNFEIRKQLLEYDNILNEQRKVIYKKRYEIISTKNISFLIQNILRDVILNIINIYCPNNIFYKKWKIIDMVQILKTDFHLIFSIIYLNKHINFSNRIIFNKIYQVIKKKYYFHKMKDSFLNIYDIERRIMLFYLDKLWKEHLLSLEYLKRSIHLRSYAQKEPKQEYIRESFIMFTNMLNTLKHEVVLRIFEKIFFFKMFVKIIV
ncbi:preprotein translocase subunit SecA [Buchnera aphidicola]|uniref:Protein translocase subunit SecA n=1 Tax=Buchnera aphidicola (Stegophylla sp.) TaxID=2315800 RepID=A0A4D6YK55_9GAMM|nr:preprotein translocase subunit SecA [Buchnera aphidicola (Stegophylla sp.)]QCI26324.1 preprotein translocase subunit SecA [Buchnera aphidicola (Stegophylla sp.)]